MNRGEKTNSTKEKYIYSPSDLHFSSGWRTEDFRSADKQRTLERQQSKTQNAENLRTLISYIEENQICSFAVFMREVFTHLPNLQEVSIQNHALLRDYIRDKRYDVSCGFADMDYKTVCKELKEQREVNYEQETRISELWDTIRDLTAECERIKEKYIETKSVLDDTLRLNKIIIQDNLNLQYMIGFEDVFVPDKSNKHG